MRIAILSQNRHLYSTSRLVEAAEKRNIKVSVLNPIKCKLIVEKGNPQIFYSDDRSLDIYDGVIPRIGASISYYGAAVVRQFEMMGAETTISSEALLRTRDKLQALQRLSRSGLGLPKTGITNYTEDPNLLINSVGGSPTIIKLLEGTQGLGVILAESKKAASSVIEAFNKLKARVIVQEFIKESSGTDIRAIVVDGEVIAAMQRIAPEGEFRSNIHRGATGKAVQLDDKFERAAIKACNVLKLDVAGVDMLISDRGPLILEVNASPGLEGIEKYTEIDVANKIVGHLVKKIKAS